MLPLKFYMSKLVKAQGGGGSPPPNRIQGGGGVHPQPDEYPFSNAHIQLIVKFASIDCNTAQL